MCTAVTFSTKDHYFGRNLDYEHSYRESVTITPRNFAFQFRRMPPMEHHYAMIGMATVANGYPLYYDATNEYGLSIAGLNFPLSAQYMPEKPGKDNIAPFELIPWVLGSCRNVPEAEEKLADMNLVNIPFSQQYPLSPLHWILADPERADSIEQTGDGLHVYHNPVGVLTNEPPFPFHMMHLQSFLNVTSSEPVNRFSPKLPLKAYSRGMGGIGLPGDLSSSSRFIKAAFTKLNSVSEDTESASISQVFHILGSVAQQQGCVKVGKAYEKTIYTSCCNTTRGIYYYTTYENSQITGIRLHGTDLGGKDLVCYPLVTGQRIRMEN